MARTARHHLDPDEMGLNLAPIMSILVLLIPMLLFSFTFFEVKVQAVSAPRMGSPDARPPADKPLNLTVLATERGFELRHRDAAELPVIALRSDVSGGADAYDYAALYNALVEIKRRYPQASRVFVGGHASVPWRQLARTLDAVRGRLAEDRYDSVEAWSAAPARLDSDGAPVGLFAQVSLAVLD